MDAGELRDRAERLQTQMVEVGERFAEAAGPALARWLEGAVERLVVAQADRINALKPEAMGTLRRAVAAATARAAEEATGSLREPALWLEPTVTVDRFPDRDMGVPNHRAWIALLRAVRTLDPVLTEFGLQPNPAPAFGGARFGLEPRRLPDVDRSGSLDRLWDRYLDLLRRYQEALERIPQEEERLEREEALRRWRDSR